MTYHVQEEDGTVGGPRAFSDLPVVIRGERRVVASASDVAPPLYLPGVEPPQPSNTSPSWVLNGSTQLADTVWNPLPERTPEQAADEKRTAIDARWDEAVRNGIPVTVNGLSAVLRFLERDERRWALWNPGIAAPAGGLLVALQEPFNDKDQIRIQGAPKLTSGKNQILAHVDTADTAWESGYDQIDSILASADPDATKVANIDAIDIEALGWPANTLP